MTVVSAACQVIWLHRMLSELKYEQKDPTKILYDNKFVITLTKNPIFYGRSKYISIKFHYIKELVKNKEIELEYRRSKYQVAYIFTKPLKIDMFEKLKIMLDVFKFRTQIKESC